MKKSCQHKKTKQNGICLKCGYNTKRLTNRELKNIEKIVKLADKIDLLMKWESWEQRKDFFSACGLLMPEETDINCIS